MEVSFVGTLYYMKIVNSKRILVHCSNFPLLKNKAMYKEFNDSKSVVTVEEKYLCFNCQSIWKNTDINILNLYDGNIIYRYIHDVLPSKRK